VDSEDSTSTGAHNVAIKIAMIGAGSVGFTRVLARDILAAPEMADTQFALAESGDGGGRLVR